MEVEIKKEHIDQEVKTKPIKMFFAAVFKNPKLIILIVLILAIALGAFSVGKRINLKTEEKTVNLSFKDIGKLSTQEAYVTKVEAMTKDRKFFGTDVKIPITLKSF
ncbi:MAG: hypothetical protein ACI4F7_07515 [Acutalibacteraceae bacterium]